MTTAPLEPDPEQDLPQDDGPVTDPSVLPDDGPEPDPADDTIEVPVEP